MNVLSLFDGMSCGQLALKRANVSVANYWASEIDPVAIATTQKNYPSTVQLGDVRSVQNLGPVDLIMAGSPCQGFSRIGQGLGFEDPRSKLYFEFLRLTKEHPEAYFLLENVKLSKDDETVISQQLGVSPLHINSSLVSAQSRHRVYWTNLPGVSIPVDRGIELKDIMNPFPQLPRCVELRRKSKCVRVGGSGSGLGRKQEWDCPVREVPGNLLPIPDYIKQWTYNQEELCRLQTVPPEYLAHLKPTQAQRLLGNGWTVDVIAHLLQGLKN